jgi:dTDP-4-amino-4,6-dideoxygalactose transaminase
MISFNLPTRTGNEDPFILDAINARKLSGDGKYSKDCQKWFENTLPCTKALLTPSCTHALEMTALLIDIQPGDEVIMPSYTFVSTANAFALRGAKIVFVDIRPDTMNLDESLIEAAITPRTKAIVPVHYAGVSCEMEVISSIAMKHNLYVIEDAAQGMMSTYNGKPLGTFGHLSAFSFHETKIVTSGGEGGLLIVNDERFAQQADIIREKGTNRNQFNQGKVDKYTWVALGSSYLPSELQAAYLWGQLEMAEVITADRLSTWAHYNAAFQELKSDGKVELPTIPLNCKHNGQTYYLKCADLEERTALIAHLKKNDIMAVFHYIPLHSAPAGQRYGRFHGEDRFTTKESERLVRLPLWYGMRDEIRERVMECVYTFYA